MENTKISEKDERLKKINTLVSEGVNPYPASSKRTHTIDLVLQHFDQFEKDQSAVIIAGRLKSKRAHGNLCFSNLYSNNFSIQLAFSKKEMLGGDGFEYKDFIKLIDIGDFVEISGICFTTHKGEKSIMVKSCNLLTKAILPLPEKWHGLKDDDEKLRKRYLDILMNPDVFDIFVKRAKFWEATRNFLQANGFMEVETPTIENTTGGAEANPFKTHHNDFDIEVFLRISIGELWQKRLMAAGIEKTFEIGRAFRNEGSSPDHLQEFTNMEFYWAYADYEIGMKFTREMYIYIANQVFGKTKFKTKGYEYDLNSEWSKIDYCDEILKQTGINILQASNEEMENKLNDLKVKYEGNNRERLTDTLWKYCRKNIAGPVFLVNHPKLISPLAKEKDDNRDQVQRFQIIIAGSEIGNGYSELNNPIEQRKRFEEQQELIKKGDAEAMMPDWEFVEMLEHGMPPTFGFGFGERLFGALMDKPLREVTLFPLLRPKKENTSSVIDEK